MSARNMFVVPIEPLDNRYTKQWFDFIPRQLKKQTDFKIIHVAGYAQGYDKPTAGAFFDFSATMEYKNNQAQQIARFFSLGVVKPNDVFFFTDAWNPTVHTVRYISELTGIPVKCAGIWHAGWYDPTDILGFTIKNSNWISNLESSMYEAYDHNYFGTEQHLDKFARCYPNLTASKAFVCGYPLDYLSDVSINKSFADKKKMVVFPHRLNEDKAPYIFDYIANYVRVRMQRMDIEFVKTQDLNLPKDEYYNKLNEAMVIFSANKHENLGIGTFEAMMMGAHPFLPNKLSYKEMYPEKYKYPEIEGFYEKLYAENYWRDLAERIVKIIDSYDENLYNEIVLDSQQIFEKFFSCNDMINKLKAL